MAIHAFHSRGKRLPNDPIASSLERAQRALPDDPDMAALYLDGALRDMLAIAARLGGDNPSRPDEALCDLDRRYPLLAQRFRLALRAPNPEARLIHCWRLLDSLSPSVAAPSAPRDHEVKG